jgi:thiamine biosynthesis protein ThiI
VPFAEIQVAVRDGAPEAYRTVLYRRMMQRIAARIAAREGCGALVTGESLGQVASQTMENIACIEAAADLTVLRPLIGFDKQETIAIARRIGTYDISARAEPDCCTVFQPARPVIRGRIERCLEAESRLDVEGLIERAVAGLESLEVGPG